MKLIKFMNIKVNIHFTNCITFCQSLYKSKDLFISSGMLFLLLLSRIMFNFYLLHCISPKKRYILKLTPEIVIEF